MHTEHAKEHEEKVQPRLLHQRCGAGKAADQPKQGGGQQQPGKQALHARKAMVELAVAVYHLGAAQEFSLKAAAFHLAQGFGNQLGIGSENMASLLQQAHQFG